MVPVWRSQPWYPALLELLVNFPLIILPRNPTLLTDLFNNPPPLVATEQLQLVAWKLSSVGSKQKEFLKKLPNCWQLDGVEAQIKHIRVPGRDGMAGAVL